MSSVYSDAVQHRKKGIKFVLPDELEKIYATIDEKIICISTNEKNS